MSRALALDSVEPAGLAGSSVWPADPPVRPAGSRARLIAAAESLVEASGYEALTVSALCEEAGLSRQTFYSHFADKRACLAAAYDPELAQLAARLNDAADQGRPWAEPMLRSLDQTLADLHGSSTTPRARIVAAMEALAGERGYEQASLAEVTGAAGVTRSAFYAHFADRRECFAAAHAELISRIDRHLAEAASDGADPAARAAEALRALASLLAAEPVTARIVVLEAGVLAGAPEAKAEDAPGSLGELIDRHVLAGLDAPSHAARRIAVGGVLTLLGDVLAADGADSLPALLPELCFAALCPILGPEAAIREMERIDADTGPTPAEAVAC